MAENKAMSLRESAQHDHSLGLREKLTGWGIISNKLANPNSKSQKRKKNRK